MLESIIFCTANLLRDELKYVLEQIPRLITNHVTDIDELKKYIREHSVLFVLIADGDQKRLDAFKNLSLEHPQIYFIYYYPELVVDSLHFANFNSFSHIITGENRSRNLLEILLGLTKSYWKKIPYHKLDISYESLTPRLKRVMHYIETNDLKNCGTGKIAAYLKISQGYFSQEFKRETRITFRSFMQKLIDHYETIIFNRLDLSAKSASRILGYSELSSFSRSFKKRKGYPPSKQKEFRYSSVDNPETT